jgi:hypothetical protein
MLKNLILKIKTHAQRTFNKPKYPCKDCHILLLEEGCTQICDKVITDNAKLRKHMMIYNDCPDCGTNKWYGGPSGGMSQNIMCSGCNHQFNTCLPILFERINI